MFYYVLLCYILFYYFLLCFIMFYYILLRHLLRFNLHQHLFFVIFAKPAPVQSWDCCMCQGSSHLLISLFPAVSISILVRTILTRHYSSQSLRTRISKHLKGRFCPRVSFTFFGRKWKFSLQENLFLDPTCTTDNADPQLLLILCKEFYDLPNSLIIIF